MRLARLILYFDPKDVKTEREQYEDVYYIECDIKDELLIWPDALDDRKVVIHFDGGSLTMPRETFLKLVERYEREYQRRIGAEAVDHLLKRVDRLKISDSLKKAYKNCLTHLKQDLETKG